MSWKYIFKDIPAHDIYELVMYKENNDFIKEVRDTNIEEYLFLINESNSLIEE